MDGGWEEEPIEDGHKGLGAVRALNCEHEPHDPLYVGENNENGETKLAAPVGLTSSAEENEAKNVSYSYTLWVGTNVTEVITMTLTSPKNTSFFKAMIQAAEIDSRFSFDAREWPNGHYVHTLAGKKEEPRGYNFWILYRLPEYPEISSPPGNQLIAPVGE
uniref:CSON008769 protein n=1 Tax=Culicoides sonorensis TaxID=179676 RepID=A0A336N887_CULSO